ncbi:class I SAM-dependent RNA methyltransferase [Congregibacter sp.]|uniref:class I SAM-dependent RNA methyltransferase n=1 Tax=Congregibacter sp. TaxID=2744308 RepID=UPI003F6BD0CC
MFKRPIRKSAKRDVIRPGHRFEGEVRDLNSDGQAVVAHPDGRVFFVPGAWRGEKGLFEVTQLKGRMGFARLVSLTEESPRRRSPPCPHNGFATDNCGGCPWMFMEYAEQLRSKELQLQKMLQALNPELTPGTIWASPEEFAYRNRAQLKTDGRRLGYVASNSREIAEISDCLVLNTKNQQTLKDLKARLPNPEWKPSRAKHWSTLDLDDDIIAADVTANQRRPFRQGNSAQNQRMRDWLASKVADLETPASVVELFAGSGNFTDILVASGCKNICAVDSFRPAIERLQSRSLPGVTGLCSDLGRPGSAADLETALSAATLLLLDPPREGLKNIDDYLKLAPRLQTIIYISCDLATLARDLNVAIKHRFQLREVQPLDLFPQTPHIEALTVLTR